MGVNCALVLLLGLCSAVNYYTFIALLSISTICDSVKISYSISVHRNGGACHPVCLVYVFLIVFGQEWGLMAQGYKLYEAQATHSLRLSIYAAFHGFVDKKKNTEHDHLLKAFNIIASI